MIENKKLPAKSGIIKAIFPIEFFELKKFLPMALMMMFIILNYSMLRSIKDGLIVPLIGAEALSFIKTCVVLPTAVIAMLIYAKLCNILETKKVFYVFITFFILFFVSFSLFIYPNVRFLHPDPVIVENLAAKFPYLQWFFRIWGQWSFAAFYAICELWGSIMLSLLFWQFANQITKTSEAKRFYSMFGIIGNIGPILTDQIIAYFYRHRTSPDDMITSLVLLAALSGVVCMVLYWFMNNQVLTDPRFYDPSEIGGEKKKKAKLSLAESFKLIFSSKYIGLIAVLVLSYGVSISLVEGVWKSQIKLLYPNSDDYIKFMGNFQGYQGWVSIAFMFMGATILRKFSWFTSAVLTPLMILITGLAFFTCIFARDWLSNSLAPYLVVSPLFGAVILGAVQNILSKSTKYSLFDSTKEMAYIPLDNELKTKGKAAVDVVGGRLGKSGGGFIQLAFFMSIPTLTFLEAVPYFAVIFFGIVIIWIFAVKALSKEYKKLIKDHSY